MCQGVQSERRRTNRPNRFDIPGPRLRHQGDDCGLRAATTRRPRQLHRKDVAGSNVSETVDLENRAKAYLGLQMYDEAIADYSKEIEIEEAAKKDSFPPLFPGRYQLERGIAFHAKGDVASARLDFLSASDAAPKDTGILHWLAWNDYDGGDEPEAITAFTKELALSKAADPYTVIMLYLAGLRASDPTAAKNLAEGAARIEDKLVWPWPMVEVLLGKYGG